MLIKRLRFLMPHVPLKVLRGEKNEDDFQDHHYERFQAPGTATEEEEEKVTDYDSRSSVSEEDATTDMGELSDEGMGRYLGRHTGPMYGVNQVDDDFSKIQNYLNENAPQYDTTGSINQEAADVIQMHHLPNRDVTSNDSLSNEHRAPLLNDEHSL